MSDEELGKLFRIVIQHYEKYLQKYGVKPIKKILM